MKLISKKKVIRACPICENNKAEVLHTQHFSLSKDCMLPNNYDVVACIRCGFVYADTKATQLDYDQYYKDLSKYEDTSVATGTGQGSLDAQRLKRAAADISKHITNHKKSILDIGCANGGLLSELRNQGFNDLTGLDPSSACVSYVNNLNIDVYLGSIFGENVSLPKKKFDLVILSHVLEHILDVRSAYKNALSLLKEDGLLYIEVPDASRYRAYYVVPYFYFDCEHINHFDLTSLGNLASINGLARVANDQIEIVASDTYVYPAVYALYRKENQPPNIEMVGYDADTKDSIVSYIDLSKKNDQWPALKEMVSSQKELVVWGAGSYAQRMLETSPLGQCNILAFIDRDSNKIGRELNGRMIKSPDFLWQTNAAILICSALHNNEIASEVKAMGVDNEIWDLKGKLNDK